MEMPGEVTKGFRLFAIVRLDPVMGRILDGAFTEETNAEVFHENLVRGGKNVFIVPMVPEVPVAAAPAVVSRVEDGEVPGP